jgi:uncharacterized membrane protein
MKSLPGKMAAAILFLLVCNGSANADPIGFIYTISSNSFVSFELPNGTSEFFIARNLGINDQGQIVGSYSTDPFGGRPIHGFMKQENTVTSFDYPGADNTSAHGINSAGQIVGSRTFSNSSDTQAFLKDGNTFTSLAYPGADATIANGINDNGQIVGRYRIYGGPLAQVDHGLLINGNTLTSFDYPGATQTTGFDINNAGQIVGFYSDATSPYHGFIKNGDTFTTVDYPGATHTRAFGINDFGQIVGTYSGAGYAHGFIKDGDTFTSFDFPGAQFTSAFDINNFGQVVGFYELPPPPPSVAEPNSMVLLGSGLFCLIQIRRRFKRES